METFERRRLVQRLAELLTADRLTPVADVEVAPGVVALAAYPPARLAVVTVADVSAATSAGGWRVLAIDLEQLSSHPDAIVRRVRAALNRRERDRHPTAGRARSQS